jgi:hypothetical protein
MEAAFVPKLGREGKNVEESERALGVVANVRSHFVERSN